MLSRLRILGFQRPHSHFQVPQGHNLFLKSRLSTIPRYCKSGFSSFEYTRPYSCSLVFKSNRKGAQQFGLKRANYSSSTNSEKDPEKGWFWIPVKYGIASIALLQLYHVLRNEFSQEGELNHDEKAQNVIEGPWQIQLYVTLPLRAVSRLFGAFNELEIPNFLRKPLLSFYCFLFNCNKEDFLNPDLSSYTNLSEFFYRQIKLENRPISKSPIVSPSDGKILHFGVVQDNLIEQVKGIAYKMDDFLGTKDYKAHDKMVEISKSSHSELLTSRKKFAEINSIEYSIDKLIGSKADDDSANPLPQTSDSETSNTSSLPKSDIANVFEIKENPNNQLYYAVIYLAPGDYHRFHSPTDWTAQTRRHFSGELYSVSPYLAKKLPNLFVLNERVCLLGKWQHGFFGYVPVGATNVGSIQLAFESDLKTNIPFKKRGESVSSSPTSNIVSRRNGFEEVVYSNLPEYSNTGGVNLQKGEEMGGFKLGSTVVLIFEAPSSFEFKIQPDQKIKMGEAIGDI
ncbi:hypothetical protein BB560_007063 [Smittium megazygosporum]|uniref:Phosphatidylserine decarboxylase proenzyme 1, mitochondrial n=1 Tax=Smittium megazygosporum TaxID=133381 RepID=A0A2T9XZ31_9FUNG|nr:hypothetical protein BB560_007063 [Smittium megazygosporum]